MIDGRTCTQCKEWKPTHEFSWKGHDHKRLASRCHACRRSNYKENPERNRQRARDHHAANREVILEKMHERRVAEPSVCLLRDARRRAKKKGIPFDLTIEDVSVPDRCPVLGVELCVSRGKCTANSPTLDRIIPALGYVKGNVAVISHRANMIKSDASVDEILMVANYIKSNALHLQG